MMSDYLPVGLRGLMLASFAAAYTSTQATQMNWGSSYLMNDLYRRFMRRDATEQHYVLASRIATFVTLVLSIVVTIFMDQISKVWEFLLTLGAGTGLVYILRWYWWRVNAWSEVSAMASALVTSLSLRAIGSRVPALDPARPEGFALNLIVTTARDDGRVARRHVRDAARSRARRSRRSTGRCGPRARGWGPIARSTGIAPPAGEIARNFGFWVLGITLVYSIMFCAGGVIFHLPRQAAIFGVLLVLSGTPARRGSRPRKSMTAS